MTKGRRHPHAGPDNPKDAYRAQKDAFACTYEVATATGDRLHTVDYKFRLLLPSTLRAIPMSRRGFFDRNNRTRYRTLFARNTRRIVVYISTALALGFTVLQFKDFTVQPVINASASEVIWRGALLAYFWCWRFGCVRDTDIQELAYASLPNKGQWPLKSYGIVALLVGVAIVLVAAQGDIFWFSIALTFFFITDHVGWRHLVKVLAPEARKSEQEFIKRRDFIALERLKVVRAQIQGNWKWWRLYFGAAIIILTDAFAFVPAIRSLMTNSILMIKPSLSIAEAEVFLYSLLVLIFVVVMEIWHYWIRLKTKITLAYIDELGERYALKRS